METSPGYRRQTDTAETEILLIFCPLLYTSEPHLAIPHLAGYLRSRGRRVRTHDFNIEWFRMFRRRDFLFFLRELLEAKLHRIKSSLTGKERFREYLKINLSLQAVESLLADHEDPLTAAQWPLFASRVFAVQAAFGFETLVQNDFTEFCDDYFSFLGRNDHPKDHRLGMERSSTISQAVTPEYVADPAKNLFLPIFEQCLLPTVQAARPQVVALSIATNEQVIQALSMARMIKNHLPHLHVTAGGSYTGYLDDREIEKIMAFNVFDSLILHEGESPLNTLTEAVTHGRDWETTPNLVYQSGGTVVRNPVAAAEDLNAMPRPDYDETPGLLDDTRALNVFVSRGCYWGRCTYCSSTISDEGRKSFSLKTADELVAELEWLSRRYDTRHFNLISESIPPAYARELAERILASGLKLEISLWARPEKAFTPDVCRVMAEAGFRLITLGVESLSDGVLKRMQKGLRARDILTVMRSMNEAGILLQINIMVGFPGESRAEALETHGILEAMLQESPVFRLVVGPFAMLRGSAIHNNPDAYGLALPGETGESFRPKGIFIPFSYSRRPSFTDVLEILSLYHQSHAFSAPDLPPLLRLNEGTGWRILDYQTRAGRVERKPAYIFYRYGPTMAEQVDPLLGHAIVSGHDCIDVHYLLSRCRPATPTRVTEVYRTLQTMVSREILVPSTGY